MSLSLNLAEMCVKAAAAKRADASADLRRARDDMESLVVREQALRRGAGRFSAMADSRSLEEDTSPGGYLRTGLERTLVPVPHSGGEALVRGIGALAGGSLAGQYAESVGDRGMKILPSVFGRRTTTLAPDELKRIVSPTGGLPYSRVPWNPDVPGALAEGLDLAADITPSSSVSRKPPHQVVQQAKLDTSQLSGKLRAGSKGVGLAGKLDLGGLFRPRYQFEGLGSNLREAAGELAGGMSERSLDKGTVRLLKSLNAMKGGELSGLMQEGTLKSDVAGAIGKGVAPAGRVGDAKRQVETLFGQGGMSRFRDIIEASKPQQKKGPITEAISSLMPKHIGAKLLGGLAGASLTGIPFALRAMAQKSRGGEAAESARSRMHEAVSEAEQAAAKREEILSRAEGLA